MAVQTMNEIFQQVATLTSAFNSDEKRALGDFLIEQAKQDAVNDGVSPPLNGTHKEQEVPDPARHRELEWLKQHSAEYAGQYVALYGDTLVAHAATLKEAHRLVKESGVSGAIFTRIEALNELPFVGGW